MEEQFIIRGKKVVTVSKHGTIHDGAMVIQGEKVTAIGPWKQVREQFCNMPVINWSDQVITPSLVDCHTHLLEFAPVSLFPVTKETHLFKGKDLFFNALSAGITAIGEQICGHPLSHFDIQDYRKSVESLPIDVSFAATSISIGFKQLAHFTSVTKSLPVTKQQLIDPAMIEAMAKESEYPGENLFLNATPANFLESEVPRAGELIYSLDELKQIVKTFRHHGKRIGVHVAGEEGIQLALDAGVDVFHHAHGVTEEQLKELAINQLEVVATPIGGTHLLPNSPTNILALAEVGVPVSIATDAYLPPHKDAAWLPFHDRKLKGPDVLMLISHAPMKLLEEKGFNENDILAMITKNPAKILEKDDKFGSLEQGMDANFIVSSGIPGLDITDAKEIKLVYYRGKKVIDRS